jgi:hypothetical protein
MMATGAYTGNPNIARQGARARQIAQARNVSDVADPRTYGFMQGLLGSAPDQLGYSVFDDPETRRSAQQAAEVGLVGGGLLQAIPVLGPALKGYGRLAAGQVNRAMMGEGGLLGPITPQPMYVVPPGKSIKQMPQSKSLLDMNRTPSEAEIKKAPREDLINWLQNNDPNGAYLDPTPDPAINMYRTAKGYAIEDANTGSVSQFGDYNKAKQEFDALRFSNSEFPPMTLKEAQESAINYLRESAQPAGGGKLLQFESKPSGLLD